MPADFLKTDEFNIFAKLNSPAKVQDFVDAIPINFETKKETCRSPLMVLKHNEAHCMEGAMLAAAIFWYHGRHPLILDLKTSKDDVDHVVALFRERSGWGAVSKTNHPVLRYRDPVYRTVRELAMSYFNEYFLDSGKKTLRSYSAPFSLIRFGRNWLVAKKDVWPIVYALDKSKHYNVLQSAVSSRLRLADKIEIDSTKATQWKKPRSRKGKI